MTLSIDPDHFEHIRKLVLQRAALVLEPKQVYLVRARLIALARKYGLGSVDEFVDRLEKHPLNGLRQEVVEAMVMPETFFFRDMGVFEALRTDVLPELQHQRSAERKLSIWSAGCSTGQEPYSVAMVIAEHFPALLKWRLEFLATDLSRVLLAQAREGLYNQLEVNRGLPAPMLVKYFRREGLDWRIEPVLRHLVSFEVLNLIEPWPELEPIDLIFLRNVLSYFPGETQRNVLRKIGRCLSPDGYLFLGEGETTLDLDDLYRAERLGEVVCYRRRRRRRKPLSPARRLRPRSRLAKH